MLTGKLPYEGTSFADICALVLVSPPRSARNVDPTIPEALEAVILRCLERDQEVRFKSVLELARELAPFASEAGFGLVDRIEQIGTMRASLDSIAEEQPTSGRRSFSMLHRATPRAASPTTPIQPHGAQITPRSLPPSVEVDPTPAPSDPPPRRRRGGLAIAVALAACAVLGAAVWAIARPSSAEIAAPPSAPFHPRSEGEAAPPSPATVAATPPDVTPVASAADTATAAASAVRAPASGWPLPPPSARATAYGRLPTASASAPSPPPPAPGAPPKFDDFGGRR
jgi:hypothetical protein